MKTDIARSYKILRSVRTGFILVAGAHLLLAYFGLIPTLEPWIIIKDLLVLIFIQLLSITLCLKNLLLAYLTKARLDIQDMSL